MAQGTGAAAVAERLLRILSREEVAFLADSLGLSGANASQIADSLGALPRYEIARIVLKVGNSTVRLLQDIFDCLMSLGVSVRTTGCVFVLADPLQAGDQCDLEFSPQAVGSVCDWRADRDWEPLKESLQSMKSRWMGLHPDLSKLLYDAKPRWEEGELDVVQSFIEQQEVREPDREIRDESADKALHFLISQLKKMKDRLSQLPEGALPSEITWILRDLDEFLYEADRVLESGERWGDPEAPSEYDLYRYEELFRDLDRLREDLYLLAGLTEGERLFDMLRLDVWSSRPQLYEVWILLTILRWLSRRGFSVQLLKLQKSIATVRWELAYSKDSAPCAVVKGEVATAYLFYQLYRPSGDMPDLALLSGPTPGSAPIWTVDPKHSERGGYSMNDYRLTAKRYRDSFGAPISIVVEYFRRADCVENPVDFGGGAYLIHDCGPSRSGLDLLLRELSPLHPALATTVVCIDVSQSFASHLALVLPRIGERLDETKEPILDEFVCFAGNATRMSGLRTWLRSGETHTASTLGLEDGTRAGPLLGTIASVVQGTGAAGILLVTDGSFDVPLESVVQHLREGMGLDVRIVSVSDP